MQASNGGVREHSARRMVRKPMLGGIGC